MARPLGGKQHGMSMEHKVGQSRGEKVRSERWAGCLLHSKEPGSHWDRRGHSLSRRGTFCYFEKLTVESGILEE